jgi:adenylate kinase
MTENDPYRTILMFGAPGSGKGTQGRLLGDLPGFFHCACGDVFRRLNPNSELGKSFLQYSSNGHLVPDNLTIQLWLEHIHGLARTGQFHPEEEILVLDGIPRSVKQARMMEEYINVILFVSLEAPDEETLVARIKRRALHANRLDDANEDIIRERFHEYATETEPLRKYYPDERVHGVDAGQEPIAVLQDVVACVREGLAANKVR